MVDEIDEHKEDMEEDIEDEKDETVEEQMEWRYGPRRREGLRPRKPPTRMTDGYKIMNVNDNIHHMIFTQLNAKQGLKMFGEKGEEALVKELKQLHTKDVLDPMDANELTYAMKKEASNYLMYLTEKRCGKIKGRGCADGRKQ